MSNTQPQRNAPVCSGWRVRVLHGSGKPEQLLTDPSHADFWRAMPDGRLLLIREYQEDAHQEDKGIRPATAFDLALPILRVAECFLHARSMCERLGVPNASVIVTGRYSGLAGRELISLGHRLVLSPGRKARQQEIDLALTASTVVRSKIVYRKSWLNS